MSPSCHLLPTRTAGALSACAVSLPGVTISWAQALAWRMRRHLLEPVAGKTAADVVQRLGAVPAMDADLAELAVRSRLRRSRPGVMARAIESGELIKSFAFRGATHYLSATDAGAYLALRASSRQWELPSWQRHYQLQPADWPAFRETVRAALAGGPLTLAELGTAVTRKPAYRRLGPIFAEGAGTLIKPLTWQGDMSFGALRDGRHTFQRLDDNPHWTGIWDLDEAGRYAITAYLRAYAPATEQHIHYWLGEGLSAGRKRLTAWLAALKDLLTAIDVEGETHYVLAEDAAELSATQPANSVRLLPGHDQWVLGPGTNDQHVVAPARRALVTRKANLVIVGGVVAGTWSAAADELTVSWFAERGKPPRKAIEHEAEKLGDLLDRPLRTAISIG